MEFRLVRPPASARMTPPLLVWHYHRQPLNTTTSVQLLHGGAIMQPALTPVPCPTPTAIYCANSGSDEVKQTALRLDGILTLIKSMVTPHWQSRWCFVG
jgi:hypothetical protein